jgi:arylsulfatase A-like enzyme
MGESSRLRFFVGYPRDLNLRLRCRPYRFDGAPRQLMRVLVNERQIAEVALDRGGVDAPLVTIPRIALRTGINKLQFAYSYSRRPKDVTPDSDDYRPLAVQWDTVEFLNALETSPPQAVTSRGRSELRIPRRGRIDYHLRIEPPASLRLDGMSAWGAGETPSLEVVLRSADAAGEKVLRIEPPSRGVASVALPLPLETERIVRLSLQVGSGRQSDRLETGLKLLRPVIELRGATDKAVPASVARSVAPTTTGPTAPPNVVLYVIDTLRADHLGCYGYPEPTSPAIDRFAAGAIRFENPVAQSSWTKPSVASILSGMYPQVHGANSMSDVLSKTVPTLAELLQGAGYATAGFVTNSVLSSEFGFDQGFAHFEYLREKEDREFHVLSHEVNRAVFSWLLERPEDKPFFLFVHTMDPHAPYTPREPYRSRFAGEVPDPDVGLLANVNGLTWQDRRPDEQTSDDLQALYDGEIAFNDASFGALLQELESLGVLEGSLVVLVSDHGEEFGDHHRWQHGFTLYQEMLRVPLIMRFPGGLGAGRAIEDGVRQVDILPTVLEFAGLEPSPGVQGMSLLPLVVSGRKPERSMPAFSFILKQRWRDVASITMGEQKLIWNRIYDAPRPRLELYDLGRDPNEAMNIAEEQTVMAGYMLSLIRSAEASWSHRTPDEQGNMTRETEERLRALGYIQ